MANINPWGLTWLITLAVSLLFVQFLWTRASPTPVVRRFIVLLVIENLTLLTSAGGILLLLGIQPVGRLDTWFSLLHHLGDVLMLTLYPVFVAYALPVKLLKPLTTTAGRYSMYALGTVVYLALILMWFGVIASPIPPDIALYTLLVIMFVVILAFSALGVGLARTRLEKNKAIAFFCAFGIRDLAWATVYAAAASGFIEGREQIFTQVYVGGTLLYIPIMAYGILQAQLLDIDIRLRSTIKNTMLASAFLGLFFIIAEVANNLLSDRLGTIIGLVVSGLLTVLLSPLHRWAERFANHLIEGDSGRLGNATPREHEIYRAAVEEAIAFGEISQGQLALIDRLRATLGLSEQTARQLEHELAFHR